MRALAIVVVAVACGPKPPPEPIPPAVGRPISVEWKAEQADGNAVNVTLVVDGKPIAVGTLDSLSEESVGNTIGPQTCALRAAHPLRTELVCGMGNYYAAELHEGELVISLVAAEGEKPVEVKRMPATGEGFSVSAFRL